MANIHACITASKRCHATCMLGNAWSTALPYPRFPQQTSKRHHRSVTSRKSNRQSSTLVLAASQADAIPCNVPLTVDPYTALADKQVYLVSEQASVRFGDLWEDRDTAVIFWARSMGCPFCWELSIELHRNIIPQLQPDGIKLFLVSIGIAERGKDFVAKTGFPADRLLADPQSVTYGALGLKKGIVDTFMNRQTPLAIGKRLMTGNSDILRQEVLPKWEPWQPPQQDQALQQGGLIVFKGHKAVWAHFDPATSVHADLKEVVQQAKTARQQQLQTVF